MNPVYAVVVTFNGERDIPLFCESFNNTTHQEDVKLIVVDNNSEDTTLEIIKKVCPDACVIQNKKNEGFARGSNIGIRYALERGAEYVMLANQDLIFEKNWLSPLVKSFKHDEHLAAVQPLVMLYPEKEKINSCGNVIHFLGFGYTRGYLKKKSEYVCTNGEQISAFSGSAVLLRATALNTVGLLDEEYFMYHEDSDLGWRFRLNGYSCAVCTDSVVYHHYEFSRSIKKFYLMERNRYLMMLKNYSLKTLCLIAPFFFVWECGMIFYSLCGFLCAKKTIGFPEKIQGYAYFWSKHNWKKLLEQRKKVQNMRKVSDKEIVRLFASRIEFQDIQNPVIQYVANPLATFYWRIIRKHI